MGRIFFTTSRLLRFFLIVCLLSGAAPSQACAVKGCSGNLWALGQSISGVPAVLVYGIALQESGQGTGKGRRPHFWTLNSPQGPMYFSSRGAAEVALMELLKTYTNVDIGAMQVNWGANGRYFVNDARELLDPKINLIVGALVLKDAVAASGGNLDLGIGRYHSWKLTDKAREYSSQVFSQVSSFVH